MTRLPWLLPLLLLGGCASVSTLAGIGAGAIAGGATANPAVGYVVGVGTAAATDYGLKYYGRTRQRAEQDAIAQAASGLAVGQGASWRIEHTIPYGNENGDLRVVRHIDNALADCKQIIFSVIDGKNRAWYSADICHQARQWKWASAEPAVQRWGNLQQ